MDLSHDTLERYRLHAEICKVLTDPKRLMLLDTLRGGEQSVGELAAAIGVALPNASQHLAVLRIGRSRRWQAHRDDRQLPARRAGDHRLPATSSMPSWRAAWSRSVAAGRRPESSPPSRPAQR